MQQNNYLINFFTAHENSFIHLFIGLWISFVPCVLSVWWYIITDKLTCLWLPICEEYGSRHLILPISITIGIFLFKKCSHPVCYIVYTGIFVYICLCEINLWPYVQTLYVPLHVYTHITVLIFFCCCSPFPCHFLLISLIWTPFRSYTVFLYLLIITHICS